MKDFRVMGQTSHGVVEMLAEDGDEIVHATITIGQLQDFRGLTFPDKSVEDYVALNAKLFERVLVEAAVMQKFKVVYGEQRKALRISAEDLRRNSYPAD